MWEVCGSGGTSGGETITLTIADGTCSSAHGGFAQEEEEEAVVVSVVSRALLDDPGTGDDSMCEDTCSGYIQEVSRVVVSPEAVTYLVIFRLFFYFTTDTSSNR